MANHKAAKGKTRVIEEDFIDEDDAPAGKGHNNPPKSKPRVGGIESGKLKSYIERIEKLSEEIADINGDRKDVFAEAKSNGFDTKTMRKILAARKLKMNERAEQEYMYDLYARALGMTTEELDETLD